MLIVAVLVTNPSVSPTNWLDFSFLRFSLFGFSWLEHTQWRYNEAHNVYLSISYTRFPLTSSGNQPATASRNNNTWLSKWKSVNTLPHINEKTNNFFLWKRIYDFVRTTWNCGTALFFLVSNWFFTMRMKKWSHIPIVCVFGDMF